MEIITQQMNTREMNIRMVKDELTKLSEEHKKEDNSAKSKRIKLSLDITNPCYIDATLMTGEIGEFFRLEYFRKVPSGTIKSTYTGDVFLSSADRDIDIMFQAVATQMEAEENEFYDRCYKAYQLDWMISHGRSIDDFYDAIRKSIVDQVTEGYDINNPQSAENAMQCAVEEFDDAGFGCGSLWACIGEFLENEYLDMAYMKYLFESMLNTKMMEELYLRYTPNREFTTFASIPVLSVETAAGTLNAYKDGCESDAISVMLKPEGYDEEIDVCMAEVITSKELMEHHGISEKDVRVITWGDATTEDYTHVETIKRSDVEEALS